MFNGWDKSFNNITGNLTVNATWKPVSNTGIASNTETINFSGNYFYGITSLSVFTSANKPPTAADIAAAIPAADPNGDGIWTANVQGKVGGKGNFIYIIINGETQTPIIIGTVTDSSQVTGVSGNKKAAVVVIN